jgi:hypothetical protein
MRLPKPHYLRQIYTPHTHKGKSQSRAQHSFSSKAGLFKINGPKQGPYQNTWQSKRRGLAVGTAGHFPAEDLEHMAHGIIEHHNPAGLLVVLRSGHRRSHNQRTTASPLCSIDQKSRFLVPRRDQTPHVEPMRVRARSRGLIKQLEHPNSLAAPQHAGRGGGLGD